MTVNRFSYEWFRASFSEDSTNMLRELTRLSHGMTRRISSFAVDGRNGDSWRIQPDETRVLADIRGPGRITHIWMTQPDHYRECLLRFTWDNAPHASVLVPLGDFFCLGHGIVNSFQSFLFTASTHHNNHPNMGCALNCYAQMPFHTRALIELVNESKEIHGQYFYIDYDTYDQPLPADSGYFHAEFRRENPFGGWGPEILVNTGESNIANKEQLAWDNNYVILETKGRGHYIGCNVSVTNLQGTWWGEGDDMIWIDGYKWPPELHGTGSEDYFNQAWGMQKTAFLRNGSSIWEGDTSGIDPKFLWQGKAGGCNAGGYQTSYVFHIENPVKFQKEIKVTIEHGHGNHLANEMSSVAYWYAAEPAPAIAVPPVEKRLPVVKDSSGQWHQDPSRQTTSRQVELNDEMRAMKKQWKEKRT